MNGQRLVALSNAILRARADVNESIIVHGLRSQETLRFKRQLRAMMVTSKNILSH